MVSAVQVATMAPMFLLTVPAGALADVADARRLLVAAQAGVVAVGALFASRTRSGITGRTGADDDEVMLGGRCGLGHSPTCD